MSKTFPQQLVLVGGFLYIVYSWGGSGPLHCLKLSLSAFLVLCQLIFPSIWEGKIDPNSLHNMSEPASSGDTSTNVGFPQLATYIYNKYFKGVLLPRPAWMLLEIALLGIRKIYAAMWETISYVGMWKTNTNSCNVTFIFDSVGGWTHRAL